MLEVSRFPWPEELLINAWHHGAVGPDKTASNPIDWALAARERVAQYLLPAPPDLRNWSDRRVGWGLVLPARPGSTAEELASDEDAPEAIRRLRAARRNQGGPAPLFRCDARREFRDTHLYNTASRKFVYLGGTEFGVNGNQLPFYLLLYGRPHEISWSLQFTLNASRAVGRLTLEGESLDQYVRACLDERNEKAAHLKQAVVWAPAYDEMTQLMRDAVAKKFVDRAASDSDLRDGMLFLDGSPGREQTRRQLAAALLERRPALIVTTSHGHIGGEGDLDQRRTSLGLPVDMEGELVNAANLTGWERGGAIWYAHACCSAGGSGEMAFDGLVTPVGPVSQALGLVQDLGPCVAPLAEGLLGGANPLRAFIGHVEPTFDWTLRRPSGQHLTASLVDGLMDGLYSRQPVGLALRGWFNRLGALSTLYLQHRRKMPDDAVAKAELIYTELSRRDIQSTVILGDPSVTLPGA